MYAFRCGWQAAGQDENLVSKLRDQFVENVRLSCWKNYVGIEPEILIQLFDLGCNAWKVPLDTYAIKITWLERGTAEYACLGHDEIISIAANSMSEACHLAFDAAVEAHGSDWQSGLYDILAENAEGEEAYRFSAEPSSSDDSDSDDRIMDLSEQ